MSKLVATSSMSFVGGRKVIFSSDLIIKSGEDALIKFECAGENVAIRINPIIDDGVKGRSILYGLDPDGGDRGLLRLTNWNSIEPSLVEEYIAVNLPDDAGKYNVPIYLTAIVYFIDGFFNVKIQMTVSEDE